MREKRILITLLALVLCGFGGCNGGDIPLKPAAFDPSTATARVFGRIEFAGTPPVPAPIRPGGSAFCVRNAEGITSEDVLVTRDGLLQNAIIFVRSGHEGRSYSAPVEPVVLDQQRCVYIPHVLTLMVNQKLTIRNSDNTFHSVRSETQVSPAFNLAQTVIGAENTVTFTHPELPARIVCDAHRWMTSYIGVFDHPFHTTSGRTGSYELSLPAGKYEIAVWHEKLGEQTMPVDVADDARVELNFIFQEKATN